MTCDERLEQLLNRAGQTISDIEEPSREKVLAGYQALIERNIETQPSSECFDKVMHLRGFTTDLYAEYLKLVEIIDRMETALENVIGERDYCQLKCCSICMDCDECGIPEVPEDWRADDEQS